MVTEERKVFEESENQDIGSHPTPEKAFPGPFVIFTRQAKANQVGYCYNGS